MSLPLASTSKALPAWMSATILVVVAFAVGVHGACEDHASSADCSANSGSPDHCQWFANIAKCYANCSAVTPTTSSGGGPPQCPSGCVASGAEKCLPQCGLFARDPDQCDQFDRQELSYVCDRDATYDPDVDACSTRCSQFTSPNSCPTQAGECVNSSGICARNCSVFTNMHECVWASDCRWFGALTSGNCLPDCASNTGAWAHCQTIDFWRNCGDSWRHETEVRPKCSLLLSRTPCLHGDRCSWDGAAGKCSLQCSSRNNLTCTERPDCVLIEGSGCRTKSSACVAASDTTVLKALMNGCHDRDCEVDRFTGACAVDCDDFQTDTSCPSDSCVWETELSYRKCQRSPPCSTATTVETCLLRAESKCEWYDGMCQRGCSLYDAGTCPIGRCFARGSSCVTACNHSSVTSSPAACRAGGEHCLWDPIRGTCQRECSPFEEECNTYPICALVNLTSWGYTYQRCEVAKSCGNFTAAGKDACMAGEDCVWTGSTCIAAANEQNCNSPWAAGYRSIFRCAPYDCEQLSVEECGNGIYCSAATGRCRLSCTYAYFPPCPAHCAVEAEENRCVDGGSPIEGPLTTTAPANPSSSNGSSGNGTNATTPSPTAVANETTSAPASACPTQVVFAVFVLTGDGFTSAFIGASYSALQASAQSDVATLTKQDPSRVTVVALSHGSLRASVVILANSSDEKSQIEAAVVQASPDDFASVRAIHSQAAGGSSSSFGLQSAAAVTNAPADATGGNSPQLFSPSTECEQQNSGESYKTAFVVAVVLGVLCCVFSALATYAAVTSRLKSAEETPQTVDRPSSDTGLDGRGNPLQSPTSTPPNGSTAVGISDTARAWAGATGAEHSATSPQ